MILRSSCPWTPCTYLHYKHVLVNLDLFIDIIGADSKQKFCLNKYRNSHCGDKMILQLSFLHNGITFIGRMISLYSIRPLAMFIWYGYNLNCIPWNIQHLVITVLDTLQAVDPQSLFPHIWMISYRLIKSPQYTGGDFMFLYRFVRRRRRRRRRRPQILVHAITFEQLFGFLSFLAWLLALTYRFTDYILVDFRRDLDLEFSRSNSEFATSQPIMVRLPRNEKQTHRLNSRLQMWPSGLTLVMTLTLNFQGQISNWLYLSQKWSDCHETKSKHIDWSQDLKCDHQVWPWPWLWPWIFKVKCEIGYICQKWSDCHEMKSKHINWTHGVKCDHQI